ncbi:MAG: radical SAM family heme chaperone HemW [Gammaproteobacteria bacterium]|nr:radical SAM family heme chaperone HemW [Gammaproteobacteria bacterium]
MERDHSGSSARRARLRIRPAVFRAGARLLLGRAGAGGEEPHQPSRPRRRRPARATANALAVPSIPLALYAHFPWCVRKCPYCDFNSHTLRGEVPEDAYIDALLRDLDWELAQAPEARPLCSIFFGGGTPSLFSGRALARLLDAIAARLSCAPDVEITLEANPGTADAQNFADYRKAGVNRLSIGVQSLNPFHLEALGRIHGPDEAHRAVDYARRAGFDNINLDLMFALPRQTLEQARADVDGVCALAPEHVSYYHLTLEPNTEFHRHPPPVPDSDLACAMLEQGQQLLAQRGYAQYEVSAYARPGRPARHNLNYWEFGDYLGIGAGAHGKRTVAGRGVVRHAKHKHPKSYLDAAGTPAALQENKAVAAADLPFEFAMNALRLNQGFPLALYEERTGQDRAVLRNPLGRAQAQGLLDVQGERVRPTALGRAHLNALLTLFLP